MSGHRIGPPSRRNRVIAATCATVFALLCPVGPDRAAIAQTDGIAATAGRTASSASGIAGQRLARDEVAGIAPTARIANRIQNRVPTRLRTRIDRDYRGLTTGAAQIGDAEDRTRVTGSPR